MKVYAGDRPSHSVKRQTQRIPQVPSLDTRVLELQGNKVEIEIQSKNVVALIDTGAMISCMSEAVFKDLKGVQLLCSSIPMVKGVGGNPIKVLGQVELPFQIGSQMFVYQFCVLSSMTQSVILGMNFLKDHQAQIKIGESKIVLQSQSGDVQVHFIQSGCFSDSRNKVLRLAKSVTLKPYHEYVVPLRASIYLNGEHLLIPQDSLFPRFQIAGAYCVSNISNGQTVFRLMNPTSQMKRLLRGTKIALANSCADTDAISTEQISDVHVVDTDMSNDQPVTENKTDEEYLDIAKQLGFKLDNTDLTVSQKSRLQVFLGKNRDIFATSLKELGLTQLYAHRIETGEARPIKQAPFRVCPEKKDEIDQQVQELLENNIIQPSISPWQSPVVLVKKKDNTYRFAVDYRKLNSVTSPMYHPLPRLEDIFDAIGNSQAQVFSTLDLASGFWQIPLDPETAHKSAFCTHSGVYEFKRLSFGMMNSPSAFCMVMNEVLRGMTFNSAVVYVDDILVYSKDFDQHLSHLQEVFNRLQQAGLRLKPSKCNFATNKVTYLGHDITKNGFGMEAINISKIKNYPTPKNVKQVRGFLGLCNYYRRFIKGFAKIALPMNRLTRKGVQFEWDAECQAAFNKLKTCVTTEPVLLRYPDYSKEFILSTDASDKAIGYVLGQADSKNREQAIAFAGRALTKAEQKWSTTEKECLAVVEGVKHFKVYLQGHKVRIYTDHKALQWLARHTDTSRRLGRWALELEPYLQSICHKPGVQNGPADALSRLEHDATPTIDSCTVTAAGDYCEYWLTYSVQQSPGETSSMPPVDTVFTLDTADAASYLTNISTMVPHDLATLQKQDPHFGPVIKFLETKELPNSTQAARKVRKFASNCVIEDGLLYKKYFPTSKSRRKLIIKQLAVPAELRDDLLRSYHDSLAGGGHTGFDKTYAALQNKYFWKSMYSDVKNYINSCEACQQNKRHFHSHPALLCPIPPVDVFNRWHIDILGPLKKASNFQAEGFQYVLVVADSFSKWCEAFPLKSMEAAEVAMYLYQDIICRYGAPRTLISDRGTNFMSKLIKELCNLFQITKIETSSYHPQTNATVERLNSFILQTLRMYVNRNQDNWPDLLPSIMMAYRMSPNASTQESPFQILFGREPTLPIDVALTPDIKISKDAEKSYAKFRDGLAVTREIARQNTIKAQERYKCNYDAKATDSNFSIGERVWIDNRRRTRGLNPKLAAKYDGPFYITQKIGECTYKLRRCDNHNPIRSPIHANRLRPYTDPQGRPTNPVTQSSQTAITQPDVPQNSDCSTTLNGEQRDTPSRETSSSVTAKMPQEGELWEIERLLKRFRYKKKNMYKVKWKGISKTTLLYEEDIPPGLIREYNIHKTAVGRVRKSRRKHATR